MPCITQIRQCTDKYMRTDPIFWLEDERIVKDKAVNLLFKFGLVIGKAVHSSHVTHGNLLDATPVV